jgi:hypothetical protein
MGRVLCLIAVLLAVAAGAATLAQPAAASTHLPVLAYHYIWFDAAMWSHDRVDRPLIGHYCSDNESVMVKQMNQAKNHGLDGFIVGWNHNKTLDSRLAKMIAAARTTGFELAVAYQSLNVHRSPRTVATVHTALRYLAALMAAHPRVFDIPGLGRNIVSWEGTWAYSRAKIKTIKSGVRGLTILCSEKQIADYKAKADLFKGDAYYWSSANALTQASFVRSKLTSFGKAVHAHAGLWLCPAAPGYDACQIGGRLVVPRANGREFSAYLHIAAQASPSAIAVISWNEFSENTCIEPSALYGNTALNVLRTFRTTNP